MAQTFCHVCYGTSLTFENGVLVCDACGTQTQTYQEETEFQQGIDDARGRRRAAGSTAASQALSQAAIIQQQETHATKQLKDAALLYVRCLQHLLRVQGEMLSSRFGVSPQVSSLLRQLWLSYVPMTGILEAKPQKQLAGGSTTVSETQAADDDHQLQDDNGDEDGEQQEGGGAQQQQRDRSALAQRLHRMRLADLVQPHNMKTLFWKLLHPQVTLQMCFLGCALLREAVTFFDIISWALDGQLPFLNLPLLSMQLASGDARSCLPVRCLESQLHKDPLKFYSSCCHMATKLGVQLPKVAGEALLMRSVQELGLPKIVYNTALQLYVSYLMDRQELQLAAPTFEAFEAYKSPYTWLASLLVIAMKILYGFSSTKGQWDLVAKAPEPPGGWQTWAQWVLNTSAGISSLPWTENQVGKLSPAEVKQYIQFCRQYMFAGHPPIKTLEDVHQLLNGWYDATDVTTNLAIDEAADQQASAANSRSETHQRVVQAGIDHPHSFNYIANWGASAPGSLKLEPDLAAVAVAVASWAHTSPVTLITCVSALEKRMSTLESAVKILKRLQSGEDGRQ